MSVKYKYIDELTGKPTDCNRLVNQGEIKVRTKSVSISDCGEPGEEAEVTITYEVLFDQS